MRTRPFLSWLPLLMLACTSPGGTRVTPAELQRIDPPRTPTNTQPETARLHVADKPLPDELVKEQQGLEKRDIDLARKLEDLDRAQAELARKRHRTALEDQGAEAGEALARERAAREHGKAAEDQLHFTEGEMPRRLAEDALALRGSWDNLLEAREELAQLEMMYEDSALGDATEEIVLNRTRRRIDRMEQGHVFREERSAELKLRTLPRELGDAELDLRSKTVSLEEARRKLELGRLARESAQREFEVEARKLTREAEDLEREGKLVTQERERWDQKVKQLRAEPTGLGGPAPSSGTGGAP
jgi:hypothetical protein